MLFVCCFCDQVRDESAGNTDLQLSVVSRMPKRQNTVVSYTCCHTCLQDDPLAITFRTRRTKSNLSAMVGTTRRSVAA